jgi:hypothetical protein
MENEVNKPVDITKEKKAAGGKKKTNKAGANPGAGGRKRAQSTVLQNFQKNTMANNTNTTDPKNPIVTGLNKERFKSLLGMFDKKPEDTPKELGVPSGNSKMNANRFSMFNQNNDNSNQSPGELLNKPKVSIKERMEALMKSKEAMQPQKKIDPILEKLRSNNHNNDEEDEDSYDDDDLSEDNNLDISQEDNDKDKDNDNDDLGKSESLSEEKKDDDDEDKEKEKENTNIHENSETKIEEKGEVLAEENKSESNNFDNKKGDDVGVSSLNMKKVDLNKSEDLDD